MRGRGLFTTAVIVLALAAATASAHFYTYWPDSPNGYGQLGREVQWECFWGHPYEKIIFDTAEPEAFAALPDGERQDLTVTPVKREDPATGEMRSTFTFSHVPEQLGDAWIVVAAPPILVEEEGEFVQDYVKQCLHVMVEKGWDRPVGLPIEIVPLTRPYGLEPGFVFKGRLLLDGEPLADAHVEIEQMNAFYVGEEDLPRDQFGMEDVPMITRTARTDANGYVTCTLDEPGWWIVCASTESGTLEAEGEQLPRVLRGGLWVHVEEEFSVRP
ncbi:MAG: DUF4198 domain-containing protein [Candidatus Brocadiia bacterium]